MRKQLSCLLVILVIIKISCFYAMADAAVYQNGDFSYILTEKGAEITDWKGWKDGKRIAGTYHSFQPGWLSGGWNWKVFYGNFL